MGQVALQVTMDCLKGVYPGGWTETPTVVVDQSNVMDYICEPDKLYPPLAGTYTCP
jgi:hypothetical protein